MTLTLRGTVPGNPYEVITKQALADLVWTAEGPVAGASDDSTAITLSMNGRTNLFVWACSSEVDSDSTLWTTDVTGLTSDLDTLLFSGGSGGALTADTTRTSADIHP